jgi:uncharacterized protein (TIGR02246 family)
MTDDRADRASDEAAIRRLVTIYSQLLDDGRIDEWADLFTKDATFSVWGTTYEGRDGIRDGIGGMQPPNTGKHVAFATVVEVADDGASALAWTDFVSLADDGPGQWGRAYMIATAARYYDRLVRDGDRWRFAARQIRMVGEPLPEGAVPTPAS